MNLLSTPYKKHRKALMKVEEITHNKTILGLSILRKYHILEDVGF